MFGFKKKIKCEGCNRKVKVFYDSSKELESKDFSCKESIAEIMKIRLCFNCWTHKMLYELKDMISDLEK